MVLKKRMKNIIKKSALNEVQKKWISNNLKEKYKKYKNENKRNIDEENISLIILKVYKEFIEEEIGKVNFKDFKRYSMKKTIKILKK